MTNEELSAKLDVIVHNQQEVREDLTTVKEILTGNGDPTKGLIVRFDRVEQGWLGHQKFAGKMAIAAGTGLLSFAGSLVLLIMRLKWGV
jgi:hypothetical protein